MRIGQLHWVAALGVALIATSASPSPAAAGSPARTRNASSVRKAAVRKAPRLRVRRPARARRIAGRLPSPAAAERFMQDVIARERRFYQPGVAYDGETGLTFDGHPIEQRSGELRGAPRNWSAASKESLHIILLVKALTGDATARALITPDPADPDAAVGRALHVLGRKIATYRRFHERHPDRKSVV